MTMGTRRPLHAFAPFLPRKGALLEVNSRVGPPLSLRKTRIVSSVSPFRFNGLEDLAHTRIQVREHGGKDSPMHVFNITVHCH